MCGVYCNNRWIELNSEYTLVSINNNYNSSSYSFSYTWVLADCIAMYWKLVFGLLVNMSCGEKTIVSSVHLKIHVYIYQYRMYKCKLYFCSYCHFINYIYCVNKYLYEMLTDRTFSVMGRIIYVYCIWFPHPTPPQPFLFTPYSF